MQQKPMRMKWKNYIFHFAMQVFCLVLSARYNNADGFFFRNSYGDDNSASLIQL